MADDHKYLEGLSGEAGYLKKSMDACGEFDDSLTKFYDALGGPDNTDTHDASCNTCKHFERRPMTKEEKAERNIFGMPGRCALKQVDVRGFQRGIYCGFENDTCYENRRTGKRPHEAKF